MGVHDLPVGWQLTQKLHRCLAFLADLSYKEDLNFGNKTLLMFCSSSISSPAFKVTQCNLNFKLTKFSELDNSAVPYLLEIIWNVFVLSSLL